jgi:hypothetical protein
MPYRVGGAGVVYGKDLLMIGKKFGGRMDIVTVPWLLSRITIALLAGARCAGAR